MACKSASGVIHGSQGKISLRVTTRQGRCRLRWVSELVDIDRRNWDSNKLIQIFNQADAEEIAKIKIPSRLPKDFIAWHMGKFGIFSIRSACNLALRVSRGQESQATTSSPNG
jgi:hypothetical protein